MCQTGKNRRVPQHVCAVLMQQAMQEAKQARRAFSWLNTGLVNQHWSAYYAARGYWGRGHYNVA